MLRIHVPRDPNDRKQCYLSHLPNTLARFLGLKDREARLTFQLVFLSHGSSIESLLDCNGIAAAPVEDLPSVGSDASDDSEPLALSGDTVSEDGEVEDTPVRVHTPPSSSETALEVSSILGSENFELGHRSRQPSYQVETAGVFVTSRQASARSIRPFTAPARPLAFPDDGAEPVPPVTQFVRLLCDVIRLGRQATLPQASQVPTNASNGDRNTTTGWPFGVRSENQLAHDIKIGAAGELYVCLTSESSLAQLLNTSLTTSRFSSFFKRSIFPASAATIGRALSAEKSLFIQTTKTLPLGMALKLRILCLTIRALRSPCFSSARDTYPETHGEELDRHII